MTSLLTRASLLARRLGVACEAGPCSQRLLSSGTAAQNRRTGGRPVDKPKAHNSVQVVPGWTEVVDKDTGSTYWWNQKTGQTTSLGAPKPDTDFMQQHNKYTGPVQGTSFGGEFRFNFGDIPTVSNDVTAVVKTGGDKQTADDVHPGLLGEELRLQIMRGILYGDPIHWVAEDVPLCDGVSLLKADGPTVARAAAHLGEHIRSTDLVAGEYEGGLKLWECAVDLVAYLAENPAAPAIAGRSVAELGCGHGLPGVFCALRGARRVAFQDYNACVLQLLTAPNLAANLERSAEGEAGESPSGREDTSEASAHKKQKSEESKGGAEPERRVHPGAESAEPAGSADGEASGAGAAARGSGGEDAGAGAATVASSPEFTFFAGDWGKLVDLLPAKGAFDVLLTSDSIYSVTSQVAAKTYYFGVGGGTRGFESLVAAQGDMTVRTAVQLNDGASNLREILEIRWTKAE